MALDGMRDKDKSPGQCWPGKLNKEEQVQEKQLSSKIRWAAAGVESPIMGYVKTDSEYLLWVRNRALCLPSCRF